MRVSATAPFRLPHPRGGCPMQTPANSSKSLAVSICQGRKRSPLMPQNRRIHRRRRASPMPPIRLPLRSPLARWPRLHPHHHRIITTGVAPGRVIDAAQAWDPCPATISRIAGKRLRRPRRLPDPWIGRSTDPPAPITVSDPRHHLRSQGEWKWMMEKRKRKMRLWGGRKKQR